VIFVQECSTKRRTLFFDAQKNRKNTQLILEMLGFPSREVAKNDVYSETPFTVEKQCFRRRCLQRFIMLNSELPFIASILKNEILWICSSRCSAFLPAVSARNRKRNKKFVFLQKTRKNPKKNETKSLRVEIVHQHAHDGPPFMVGVQQDALVLRECVEGQR
jgi:hypothetical protein